MIFAPVLAPALFPYFVSVSIRTRTHTGTQKKYVKIMDLAEKENFLSSTWTNSKNNLIETNVLRGQPNL